MTHHPPRLLRIVGIPLICLALFGLVGGHWGVSQAIAWAQMLRDYSKNAPIAEAIAKTFSGRSPCSMCTKISEEQQSETRTAAVVKFDKKAEVFLVEALGVLKKTASEDYTYVSPRPSALSSDPTRLLRRFPYSPNLLEALRDLAFSAASRTVAGRDWMGQGRPPNREFLNGRITSRDCGAERHGANSGRLFGVRPSSQ
jgi:hypothetical protein